MMSDLPGDITKQILSAPPWIMRSTRYSLTAQGRSTPSSSRLPTGRSSFEKARGWMRLPRPAAGTIPHMASCLQDGFVARTGFGARPGQERFEFLGPPVRGMLGERAGATGLGHPAQLSVGEVEGRDRVLRRLRNEDLPPRFEERLEAL